MNRFVFGILSLIALAFAGCESRPHTHPIPPQLPKSAQTELSKINLSDTLPEIVELRQADALMVTIGFAQIKSIDEYGNRQLDDEKSISAIIDQNHIKQWRAGHQIHPSDDAWSSEYKVGNRVSTARAQNTITAYTFITRNGETLAVTKKDFDEALKQLNEKQQPIYQIPHSGYQRYFVLETSLNEQTLLQSQPFKRYFVTIAVSGISTAPDAAAYLNTLPGGYNIELEVTKEIYESGDKWPPQKELQRFLHPAYFSEISGAIRSKRTRIDPTYSVITLQNEATIVVPRSALE